MDKERGERKEIIRRKKEILENIENLEKEIKGGEWKWKIEKNF